MRGDEILAELAKGWSLRAIWTALSEHKELTCGYKTFVAHVRRLQQPQLVKQMDAARFVIWLNPFWGPVADNGRTLNK